MEKYTRNARFCLICNYVSKIIPALQSRCTRFRFQPLPHQFVQSRLEQICTQERCGRVGWGGVGCSGVGTSSCGEALMKGAVGRGRRRSSCCTCPHVASV
jgi:replication factor C subunit 3/5